MGGVVNQIRTGINSPIPRNRRNGNRERLSPIGNLHRLSTIGMKWGMIGVLRIGHNLQGATNGKAKEQETGQVITGID